MNDEYMSEYEMLIDETFPLRYTWYINGYESNETSYLKYEDLPRYVKNYVDKNKNTAEALKDALKELDEGEIEEIKAWGHEAAEERRYWPEEFSLVKENGYGEKETLFTGSNAPEYDNYYGESYKPGFDKFLKKLDEAELENYRPNNIPLDDERDIKIRFFEGDSPVQDLCVDATSIRDLAEKTKNFIPTFTSYMENAYFGEDPNGDSYFSAGWVIADWVNNVWDRLSGQWKDDFNDPEYKSGKYKVLAETAPEKFTSRWITRSVEIDGHTSLFEVEDVIRLIEKYKGDVSKVTFDKDEPEPTKASLGIGETPYYQDDEMSQVYASTADWETTAANIFPITLMVCEDGSPDMDFVFEFDNPEELIEWAGEELPVIDDDLADLKFEGLTRNQTKKMLGDWMGMIIERLNDSVFESVAEDYDDDENTINYRWLSFILADKNGDTFYAENVDMANFLQNMDVYVPESILEIDEPKKPKNIF